MQVVLQGGMARGEDGHTGRTRVRKHMRFEYVSVPLRQSWHVPAMRPNRGEADGTPVLARSILSTRKAKERIPDPGRREQNLLKGPEGGC